MGRCKRCCRTNWRQTVANGGTIITIEENKTKKQPITVYGETTPNQL
jgi:hypothetical protein